MHNPRLSEQLAPIAQPKNSHARLWFAVMAGLAIAGAGVYYRQMPTPAVDKSKSSTTRFERVAEGVEDNELKLIWAERDNGSDINWTNATQYCSGLGSGWTLPSSDALSSMYDANGKYPVPYVYNGTTYIAKPATPLIKITGQWYWTNEQNGSSGAWGVVLDGGGRYSGAVVNTYYARALCVRRS